MGTRCEALNRRKPNAGRRASQAFSDGIVIFFFRADCYSLSRPVSMDSGRLKSAPAETNMMDPVCSDYSNSTGVCAIPTITTSANRGFTFRRQDPRRRAPPSSAAGHRVQFRPVRIEKRLSGAPSFLTNSHESNRECVVSRHPCGWPGTAKCRSIAHEAKPQAHGFRAIEVVALGCRRHRRSFKSDAASVLMAEGGHVRT